MKLTNYYWTHITFLILFVYVFIFYFNFLIFIMVHPLWTTLLPFSNLIIALSNRYSSIYEFLLYEIVWNPSFELSFCTIPFSDVRIFERFLFFLLFEFLKQLLLLLLLLTHSVFLYMFYLQFIIFIYEFFYLLKFSWNLNYYLHLLIGCIFWKPVFYSTFKSNIIKQYYLMHSYGKCL